jgi:hypothetical protein
VKNSGSHSGTVTTSAELDNAVGSLPVQFTAAVLTNFTHGLGYSYNADPTFQYCAEALGSAYNRGAALALSQCELSGGSSGGPWIQPMDTNTGEGPIVSVNSWGYNSLPGMYGPLLSGNSAECLFHQAELAVLTALDGVADGNAGVAFDCSSRRNLRASASS